MSSGRVQLAAVGIKSQDLSGNPDVSYFVKKTFDKMNDGDILVYADAGCSIIKNLESYKKFKIYVNLVKQHESGSLAFQMCFPEETYTKSKTFKLQK